MIYRPSPPREYMRKGKPVKGRWEIDLCGVLDNGLDIGRVRRVFPSKASAGRIGKRQAAAMARELFELWNRHGRVLRAGEKPALQRTGAMSSRAGSAPTFTQFAFDYLEFCASPSAGPKGANRPSTLRWKRGTLERYVLPHFGTIRMDKLTRRLVDVFIIKEAKAGRADGSIRHSLTIMRHMLSVARDYELIEVIPRFNIPGNKKTDVEALSPDEAARFLAVCSEAYELRRATMLEFYLRTGLRVGEGLALTPSDFDLDAAQPVVRVHRTWHDREFGPTKGDKVRVVPLVRKLAAKIDELLRARGMSTKSDDLYPFSGARTPRRPLTRDYVRKLVRAVGERAQTRPLHTHMLRHTFGTECARRGIPPLTIKEWMGHADIKVTMRYLHLSNPDHLRWAGVLDA